MGEALRGRSHMSLVRAERKRPQGAPTRPTSWVRAVLAALLALAVAVLALFALLMALALAITGDGVAAAWAFATATLLAVGTVACAAPVVAYWWPRDADAGGPTSNDGGAGAEARLPASGGIGAESRSHRLRPPRRATLGALATRPDQHPAD